jgi:hypothetical protein
MLLIFFMPFLFPHYCPGSIQVSNDESGDLEVYERNWIRIWKSLRELSKKFNISLLFFRDFSYNDQELQAGKNELTKLHTDKKKQFGPLVRWLKVTLIRPVLWIRNDFF